MAGNGQNGVQQVAREGAPCDVCAAPASRGGGVTLCGSHGLAWANAKERVRYARHCEAGNASAARVAIEDFVRRMRAEESNRAA